jgi:hypothetical protein
MAGEHCPAPIPLCVVNDVAENDLRWLLRAYSVICIAVDCAHGQARTTAIGSFIFARLPNQEQRAIQFNHASSAEHWRPHAGRRLTWLN